MKPPTCTIDVQLGNESVTTNLGACGYQAEFRLYAKCPNGHPREQVACGTHKDLLVGLPDLAPPAVRACEDCAGAGFVVLLPALKATALDLSAVAA